MKVLQHTKNERDLFFKPDRPERFYKYSLLNLHTLWVCRFSPWSCIERSVNTVSAKLVLLKFRHAQIAILDNFCSVDVIVNIVWGKNGNFRLDFLEFPSVNFHKSWKIGYNCFALRSARSSGKSVSQVIEEWTKKNTNLKITKKLTGQPLRFSCWKFVSRKYLHTVKILENFTEGN